MLPVRNGKRLFDTNAAELKHTRKKNGTEIKKMKESFTSSLQFRKPAQIYRSHIACLAEKAAAARTSVPTCDLSRRFAF